MFETEAEDEDDRDQGYEEASIVKVCDLRALAVYRGVFGSGLGFMYIAQVVIDWCKCEAEGRKYE